MDITNLKISAKTLERVQIAKSYIEKKYKMKKDNEEQKRQEWEKISKKMEEIKLNEKEKEIVKNEIFKKESEFLRLTRKKMNIRDFESLSIIGRGAFGEVRICKEKTTGQILAVKKMRKEDMFQKNQVLHVRTERDILIASNNPWVVNLKYSFQDDSFLYLAMEYLPGGDLMSLLIKRDIMSEDEARFYIAEIVLAVEAMHNMGCIHRDLKPDNILIDKNGHLKLSDFGLSKLSDKNIFPLSTALEEKIENKSNSKNVNEETNNTNVNYKPTHEEIKNRKKDRMLAFSTVGTPDYIAPEVFGQAGYGPEVDWWSVGVILFEMLVGFPPFFSENPADTCQKIVQWRKYFNIPIDANLSLEAENIIRKLIASPENRLGSYGIDAIKSHPFFAGVDWKNIRKAKAPFIPQIASDYDNKYFDKFEEQEPFYPINKKSKKSVKDNSFLNYTYKKDIEKMKKSGFLHAMEVMEVIKQVQKEEKLVNKELNVKQEPTNINQSRNNEHLKNKNDSSNKSNSYNCISMKAPINNSLKIQELKPEERRSVKSREKIEKSNSPDSKIDTNSNSSSNQGIKFSTNIVLPLKNINVIPLKKTDIPLPKIKDNTKDKKIFLTPRENKDQLILKDNHPVSAKNTNSNKITFEKNKYAQKLYDNLKVGLKHKSPSPNQKEYNLANLTSKSSDVINKKNKIS